VLPADREKFNNIMPPFAGVYNDADLASLINYVRANFAPAAARVTPAQIAAQRAK
jgi:mono/diheme cytochrome c family protein